jgi:hypothetical protein
MTEGKTPSDMVGLWREGHASGTKEAFGFAIEAIGDLAAKAKTSHGKSALRYAAKVIMEEYDRRFPTASPKPGGGPS